MPGALTSPVTPAAPRPRPGRDGSLMQARVSGLMPVSPARKAPAGLVWRDWVQLLTPTAWA